tara:strand:- start:1626 stop:1841 length:216 start_codon:yes stop_codon:yes gene_type:complete
MTNDTQIAIGTSVTFKGRAGRVISEYTMPSWARDDAWAYYSHPGARVYVVRFTDGKELSVGVGSLAATEAA